MSEELDGKGRSGAERGPDVAEDRPRRRSRIGRWLWPALAILLVVDLCRAPERQWSALALLAGIDLYQATLSQPLGSGGVRCRFEPTCSRYAEAVIRDKGALFGGIAALRRLVRCGPWTPPNTVDPP